MGISISIPEGNNQYNLNKHSHRHKRRDTIVTEMLPPPSDRYSALDVNQKHHSVVGESVPMDKQVQKSSVSENEQVGEWVMGQQKKAEVITWQVTYQQSKPALQTIPTTNNGEQMVQEQVIIPQPVQILSISPPILEEAAQKACIMNKQQSIKSVAHDQQRVCRVKGEAHTVDLKRTPIKTWREHVQRSPLYEGKQDFSIEMRQVSLGPNTYNISNQSQMGSFYRSNEQMPSMNVILSSKMAQKTTNTRQEQDSLINMRQVMRELISGKLNTNEKRDKLKLGVNQIHSLEASRLLSKI